MTNGEMIKMFKLLPTKTIDLFCYECKQYFTTTDKVKLHHYIDNEDNVHYDTYHEECVLEKIERIKNESI